MPLDMVSSIDAKVQSHPLMAHRRQVVAMHGQSISQILAGANLDKSLGIPQVDLWADGKCMTVGMNLWATAKPKPGVVVDIHYPMGDPVTASLATAALSSYAGTIATFVTGGLTSGFLFSLTAAAVTVVGGLLIHSLISPPEQEGQGDPNFAITGTGNAEAKYRPVPLPVGRHRMFPPKSATGYSETVDGEIYWRGRYTIGYGRRVGLEDIKIGNTPITEFEGVELEFLNVERDWTLANNPNGLETLTQVKSSESQEDLGEIISQIGVSGAYVWSPSSNVANAEIVIKPARSLHFSQQVAYNFRVDTKVEGQGWVAGTTYTDQSADVTWTAGPFNDGLAREFRVVLTAIRPPEFDGDDNGRERALFNQFNPSITVASTKADYQAGDEVRTWRYGAETMTLYPSDVQEEQFNVLLEEDEGVVRLTTNDAASASIDISYPQGLFDSNDGSTQKHEANYKFEYQKVGETAWKDAGTQKHRAEAKTLIRFTKNIGFPTPGEYRLRITRTDEVDGDAGDSNTGYLTAIRSYANRKLPSHKNVSEIAIRIKATDELNGRIDSLNFVVQQFAPKWNGTGWGPREPVRHPAWVALDLMRGPHLEQPIPDSKINLNDFKRWAEEEPDWTFDYVFDTSTRLRDAINKVCAAGRAKLHLADLRYSVIRDGADGPIRQVFTPRNSWNFSSNLIFSKPIHGFRVRFRSERMDWEEDEITVYLDGYNKDNAVNFETLQLPGVVITENEPDRGNPYRLGRYHLAVAILRPETFSWEADFENLAVTRGDKVRLVHDAAKIGIGAARIKQIHANAQGDLLGVVLDDVFPGAGGRDFRMVVRKDDGSFVTFTVGNEGTMDPEWVPTQGVGASLLNIGDLVVIEETTQEAMEVLITEIRPSDELTAKITGVPAAPAVLTADTEAIPEYAPIITDLPERYGPKKPVVLDCYSDERTASKGRDGVLRVHVAVELQKYEGPPNTWLRLRWTNQRGEWVEGIRSRPSSTLFTDEVPEGEPITVDVRAEDGDGNHRGWVRAGQPFGSVGSVTTEPGDWSAIPGYDGIQFDINNGGNVAGPARRGTDIAGWNIYYSDSESGPYSFLTFTDSLKTLIADTGDVRWFRIASVNYSNVEGPIGPAFYVPEFNGVNLDDIAQDLRDKFDEADETAQQVRDDIDDELDSLMLDIFGADYDFSKPLAERVREFAQAGDLVATPNGNEGIGAWDPTRASTTNSRPSGFDNSQVSLTLNDGAAQLPKFRGNPVGRYYSWSGWFRNVAGSTFRPVIRGGWSPGDIGTLSAAGDYRTATGNWQYEEGVFFVNTNAAYWSPAIDIGDAGGENPARIDCFNLSMQEVTYAKTRYDALAAVDGQNAAAIENLESTKVTESQALAAVTQQISASYGSLSGLASSTKFAKATADRVVTGHMMKVIGGYWELVGMNDGQTDTSITRIRSDRILLAGDTQVAGSFHVSGDTVILDANTQINGNFQVTGDEVRLDSNTVVTGGFAVSGSTVRIDSNTVINGNFVLGGDHILLSSGTGVDSSFVLQGRHIQLDGNVSIAGSFEVSGANIYLTSTTRKSGGFRVQGNEIILDGNTQVNGSFRVTGGTVQLDGGTVIGSSFYLNGGKIVAGSINTDRINDRAITQPETFYDNFGGSTSAIGTDWTNRGAHYINVPDGKSEIAVVAYVNLALNGQDPLTSSWGLELVVDGSVVRSIGGPVFQPMIAVAASVAALSPGNRQIYARLKRASGSQIRLQNIYFESVVYKR